MTLKIYVAKDPDSREWPPNTPHETVACEWMLKKAWTEFHHLQELYAVIVNLKEPSADMVVIREIGLGVLELKHHFDKIRISRNGAWMAGSNFIKSGKHQNPREQVKSYAGQLRKMIIREIIPSHLQIRGQHLNNVKFQTGLCFTNPAADLHEVKQYLEKNRPHREPWEESFSVFDIDFFTTWMRKLRFGLLQDPKNKNFAPVHLKPEIIVGVATRVLGAVEWEEMIAAMPPANPYGYLILNDAEENQVFPLTKDYSVIGRSHECDVTLPDRYRRVSSSHCAIERNLKGITITDLSSSNGTYLNDRPIENAIKVEHGNVLTLGGRSTGKKVCFLTFELHGKLSVQTSVTEDATKSIEFDTKNVES